MELELGLKLTSVADEFTSDFQIAKDRAAPVFVSRETDAIFLLTAHLKGSIFCMCIILYSSFIISCVILFWHEIVAGYKRRNIKIDINEDGSLIGISGERQVKETVMVGWKVVKKDTETKGFKKIYRIPDGVILDKIKAKFNEDESTLTITMPKKVKGVRGVAIEEVKDIKPELVREGSGSLQIADEKSPKAAADEGGEEMPKQEKLQEIPASVHDLRDGDEGQHISPSIHGQEKQENTDDIQEINEHEHNEEVLVGAESLSMKQHEMKDERRGEGAVEPSEEASEAEPGPRGERFKMCIPLVAGSALLMTFVAFVIQIIRSKHQTSRRRD